MEHRVQLLPIKSQNNRIAGRAIVFDSPTQISDQQGRRFVEVIRPDSLKIDRDILCTFNHDVNQLIARTSSGTLRLTTNAEGLDFEADLPEYLKPKLQELTSRGDLQGCSFTFDVVKDKWSTRDGLPYRELLAIEIYEIGPVVAPAYKATNLALRSVPTIQDTKNLQECKLRLLKIRDE